MEFSIARRNANSADIEGANSSIVVREVVASGTPLALSSAQTRFATCEFRRAAAPGSDLLSAQVFIAREFS